MKKRKFKSLVLSKKTVSTLTHTIKGGGPTDYNCGGTAAGCVTHNPTCLEPTGISFCIRCMEDFTEGCATYPFC